MSFCELHTRSAFSFLSSGSEPQRLAARAAELGIKSVGLLDRDTFAGAVRFYFEAKEQGIRSIIGAEVTLDDGTLLPLVALDLKGYQNLSRLITTSKLRSKKGEHFATRRDIEYHSAGLMCFTGGPDGLIHNSIKRGDGQLDLAWLKYVFEDRLYVELQRHHLRHEEAINQALLGLAHKLRVDYFASNGVYYADEKDRELYDVFTCIKNHTTIYDAGKLLSENSERYIKNERQMLRLFADIPEAVEITEEIAARVRFSMEELAYTFPDYPVPPGETMDSVLRQKAIERAQERYRDKAWPIRSQVLPRLEKEFRVIEMKRLAGYFLVVNDISDYCKANKILSQGRGSAANSVVCYTLGITAVDPIEHNLLFERFLSEKYEQYPDIDIDLPSGDDRESVIQHVYEKYGRRSSGMTANVICYRGKSAIREAGKTFGFGPEVLDRLSRLNSHYEQFKGDELYKRLKDEGFDATETYRLQKFSDIYHRILDFPRHLGQHSGGMVVSLDRLDGIVPLEPASMDGRTIIQWDKDDCEALKVVKIDLLGLGMMAVLRDSITLIREHHGVKLDLYRIPNNDKKVYDALQKGDTVGMFQVESRAQIAFLPKAKPRCFYDIVVQVAIIRPGPIVGNMLHSYLKRRQGFEEVSYPHESLAPILKRTLGVPLFQEQLLKIAMDIAGFSGGEADELRRAMGFKRPDRKMERITQNLRNGMTKNNIPEDVQDQIVDYTKAFANYGFPESHAYSFALLAYASAYYIIHFRACFMTAMFNNYPLGFYSAATLVKDAQRHGLHFRHLDVNLSDYDFTVEEVDGEKQVRVGLRFVRGLRETVGRAIVEERNRAGTFDDLADLLRRVPELNKREVRALSIAGALNFDNSIHRREALWQSELELRPKGTLFDQATKTEETDPHFLSRLEGVDLVAADLKKTGISIGRHPMSFVRERLNTLGILTAEQTRNLRRGDVVSVAGAVIIRQRPMTTKNVVFVTLEDETGFSNFVVMPDVFESYRAVINRNDFLIIRGVFEERGMLKALYFTPLSGISTEVVSHDFR
ncbi:MAG: DNA polymerase III subunit alpha [Acidobacteria bacterium ACB1]|nr:Error-prone DNA polymerase [Pyrinomonadaceae bacterium]MCE7961166.1 DNA polymerase III subunit alpha [Acidobacteria bacterium ACB1]RIJ93046.1 MAG: error-prone DNA polymerase [Acidobacteriota bacterium]